tara:strand:- start:1122 stop:1412 length:291 start_codon:yes stop_codon:yes gene_type:complete
MARRNNSEFIGKVWKVGSKYISVDYVKKPSVMVSSYWNRLENDDEEDNTVEFVTSSCSHIIGRNEYNQVISIELTPTHRKEAIETSWDEYLLAGVK